MRAVALLAVTVLACDAAPPAAPTPPPETSTTSTPPPPPPPPTAPPQEPSAEADIPAVEAALPGAWTTTAERYDGKKIRQRIVFRADHTFDQEVTGDDRPPTTAAGTWKILDGAPGGFTMELSLETGNKPRVATKYRIAPNGALVTRVAQNDVAYFPEGKEPDRKEPKAPPK